MVTGGRYDGVAQGISVRRTIQSIKEIVGNHSDADIYAALKESNMDPNETAQRLLNEDPFHEVKRKKDKRKENTGYKASTEGRMHSEHNVQQARSYSSWDRNAHGGSQTRKAAPGAGVSREFRIVRDNRVNQKTTENSAANKDAKTDLVQNSSLGIQQVKPDTVERSSSGILTGQKHSAAKDSEGQIQYHGLNRPVGNASGHAKNAESSVGLRQSVTDKILVPLASSSRVGDGQSIPQMHPATGGVTNSHIGVYSSSSDPVHVPSPDSRSAGTVGAIGCEVRAVGARKLSFDRPPNHPTVSNSSLLIPQMRQDISSSKESTGHSSPVSKSSSQSPGLEPVIQSMPLGKSLPSSHYTIRLQQPVTHQKATLPNMEWKPKTTQKPSLSNEEVHEVPSLSSSNGSVQSSEMEVAGLSDKVAQVNISRVEHVIIPHHLRVPESERLQLTFGSFESGFQLNKDVASSKASHSVELQHDESSVSVCTTAQVSSGEDESADDQASLGDSQGRNSPSEPLELAAESGQPQPDSDESNPTNMESYADISVVQGHNSAYISSEPQPLQNSPSPPSFSAYIPQANYGMPFFRTTVEDNGRAQNFVSTSEPMSSLAQNDSPRSGLMQQQQLLQQQQQQQQQPMAQMFPPVHVSHLPNFVPYRHFFSPVYGPPMAMPNYTGNPTYPHPSNANSYLLMPGGTSHLNPAAVKYTNSQFKPVPTGTLPGYGNFTNPPGYNMATPGTIGNTTNLDDLTRMKYKDSNPYTSNQQAETPDIWIQTARELPGMQSTPYYNLTGQAPQPAFLPAHAGHASFNPTAQPHVYPGLYHTPQQPPIANPHHLIPQQVPPGIGTGVGVGMAAPGPQVGTYQQQQMGHLNWSSNF